ncbi:hypothetical protein [Bauldia sp.]|uniref:hypothetical protein n=1 Tax=Bauldia sp. TaxID=2575872 RepID=UPI003BAABAA1
MSVRVSDDDAAFLAAYTTPGANTPSEKVRAILTAARRQHEGARDFVGCAELVTDMLRPGVGRLRELNHEIGTRSDFLMKVYERLPELMAELVTAVPGPEADLEALKKFEAAVADQVFAMVEEVLELGLTTRSRSYDPELVKRRLDPILEVLELIKLSKQQTKGAES